MPEGVGVLGSGGCWPAQATAVFVAEAGSTVAVGGQLGVGAAAGEGAWATAS